jgi:hypothetical protein
MDKNKTLNSQNLISSEFEFAPRARRDDAFNYADYKRDVSVRILGGKATDYAPEDLMNARYRPRQTSGDDTQHQDSERTIRKEVFQVPTDLSQILQLQRVPCLHTANSTSIDAIGVYFFPLPPFAMPLLLPFPGGLPFPPFFFSPTPSLLPARAPSLEPPSVSKALFFLPPLAPPPDVFRFLLADAFGIASVILTGRPAFFAARMDALALPASPNSASISRAYFRRVCLRERPSYFPRLGCDERQPLSHHDDDGKHTLLASSFFLSPSGNALT